MRGRGTRLRTRLKRERPLAAAVAVGAFIMGCAVPRVERTGAAIGCAEQVRAAGKTNDKSVVGRDCWRLGLVAIGMAHADVERALGPADLELGEPASCTNAMYVLPRDLHTLLAARPVTPDRLEISTIRVVYRGEHVAAVEVQGMAARERFGFDSVRLGDSVTAVQGCLGAPRTPSEQVWSYGPLRLLFDDDVQTVEAMAITEDDGAFGCLLPTTFQLSLDVTTGAARGFTLIRPPKNEIRLHRPSEWPGTIMLIPPRSGR